MDVSLLGCIVIGVVTPFCGFSVIKNGEFSLKSVVVVIGLCTLWMLFVEDLGI